MLMGLFPMTAMAHPFTVTFDPNGGVTPSGGHNTRTVLAGSTSIGEASMPMEPTRGGYEFIAWTTVRNSGVHFTGQSAVSGNMTVFALWGNMTVTFNLNGGTSSQPEPIFLPHGRSVDDTPGAVWPSNPGRSGNWAFDGWNTAANGSGQTVTSTTAINHNQTLFAQWRATTPTERVITFHPFPAAIAPGSSGTLVTTDSVLSSSQFPRLTPDPPRSPAGNEMTLLDWWNHPNWTEGSVRRGSGGGIRGGVTMVMGGTTQHMYPRWAYVVRFDENTMGATNRLIHERDIPLHAGHGATQTGPRTLQEGRMPVNAGSTLNYTNIPVPPPEELLPIPRARPGFHFAGWYPLDGTTTGNWGQRITTATPIHGNTTVFARWVPGSGTIILRLEVEGGQWTEPGGAGDALNAAGITYQRRAMPRGAGVYHAHGTGYGTGLSDGMPSIPVRNGYFFAGWYTLPGGQGERFTATSLVYENRTVYARWVRAIPIIFDYNGATRVIRPGWGEVNASASEETRLFAEGISATELHELWTEARNYPVNWFRTFHYPSSRWPNFPIPPNPRHPDRYGPTFVIPFRDGVSGHTPRTGVFSTERNAGERFCANSVVTADMAGMRVYRVWGVTVTFHNNHNYLNGTPQTGGNLASISRNFAYPRNFQDSVTLLGLDHTNITNANSPHWPASQNDQGYRWTSFPRPQSGFLGWNTAANGTGTWFNQTTVVNRNMDVFAIWVTDVVYHSGMAPASVITAANQRRTAGLLPGGGVGVTVANWPSNPVWRENGVEMASFHAWSDRYGSVGSTFYGGIPLGHNRTMYATWIARVDLHANGGTLTNVINQPMPYVTQRVGMVLGSMGTMDNRNLTHGDWTFLNWNTAANGSGDDYIELETLIPHNISLFAQWGGNVIFDLMGGHIGGNTNDVHRTSRYRNQFGAGNMPVNPVREGYRFLGWELENGTPFVPTRIMDQALLYVYARWERDIIYVRFHLDGSGQIDEYYIAVPGTYEAGRVWLDYESPEWLEVLEIGNIYGYDEQNEMKGWDAPRTEVGYAGPNRNWAAAFWGWFEAEDLDPQTNGRNADPTSASFIPLGSNGQPTRFRPGLGCTWQQVHPGNADSGGPIYAYGEAKGLDLDELLELGILLPADFDRDEDTIDFFGIWIRWGDLDDDKITFSTDAVLLNRYLIALGMELIGWPADMPTLHHGAADMVLHGYTFSDGAVRLNDFLIDLGMYLIGWPVPNPTRLGTRTP